VTCKRAFRDYPVIIDSADPPAFTLSMAALLGGRPG